MSTLRCWKCNLLGHHRRDCDQQVSESSAAKTKHVSQKEHRSMRGKTDAQKQKWADKCEIKLTEPLPRQFLRFQMEKNLQFLLETEWMLQDIGRPIYANFLEQLDNALKVKSELLGQMNEMRSIVSHSKNYLNKIGKWDSEDQIFKDTLDYFDTARQPLLTRCSILIADLEEINRLVQLLNDKYSLVDAELSQITASLAERSSSTKLVEAVLRRMLDIKPMIADCKKTVSILQSLCPTYCKEDFKSRERKLEQLLQVLLDSEAQGQPLCEYP